MNGELMMTAREYVENIAPIHIGSMPFCLNQRGRNGAIIEYAEFDRVIIESIAITKGYFNRFTSYQGFLFTSEISREGDLGAK